MIKHLKDGTKPFIRNSNGNISCWCLCIVIRACCKLPIVHSWLGPVYTSVVVTLSAPAPCLLMSPSRHLPSPFTWVSANQLSITTSSVKHRSPDYPGAAHLSPVMPLATHWCPHVTDGTWCSSPPFWHVTVWHVHGWSQRGDAQNAPMRLIANHMARHHCFNLTASVELVREKYGSMMIIITGNCYHGMNNHLKWPILIRFQG